MNDTIGNVLQTVRTREGNIAFRKIKGINLHFRGTGTGKKCRIVSISILFFLVDTLFLNQIANI